MISGGARGSCGRIKVEREATAWLGDSLMGHVTLHVEEITAIPWRRLFDGCYRTVAIYSDGVDVDAPVDPLDPSP